MATTDTTIRCLKSIFSVFGPCQYLVSDNAKAFTSSVFRKFCFSLSISHVTTSAYYPQPSYAERVNRNLRSALIAFHHEDVSRWDTSLPWLAFAFNSAIHETHKFSPISLMFSFVPNSPLANVWNINELLPENIDPPNIRAIWKKARDNLKVSYSRKKARYDQGRRPSRLAVGDKVFVKNFVVAGKLAPRFRGPFTIMDFLTPVTVLVSDPVSEKIFRVHLSQVKPA